MLVLKQILTHEDWRNRVAPDRILQAAIESDGIRAKTKDRRDPSIEDRVVGITILNDAHARIQQSAGGQPLTNESRDYRQASKI